LAEITEEEQKNVVFTFDNAKPHANYINCTYYL